MFNASGDGRAGTPKFGFGGLEEDVEALADRSTKYAEDKVVVGILVVDAESADDKAVADLATAAR